MTLDLTKRAEKGSAITIAEHDANFDAIEDEVNAKLEAGSEITDLDGTAWRVIYIDGSGDVVELGLGTSGQVLKSNGAAAAPSFQDETGGGGSLDNIVEDTTPQLGGDLDLNGNAIDFPTTANIADCLDEDDLSSDSAVALATQQSIKAYVDGLSYAGDLAALDAGTGLSSGGGDLNLADTAVTPASYTNADITVDQQGRITAASSGSAATEFTEVDDATDYSGTNASFKVGSDGASKNEQRRFTDNGDHDLEFIAANLSDGDFGWLIKGGTGTVTLVYNDIELNSDTADIELLSTVKWTVHDGEVLIEGGTDEDVELEGVEVVGNLLRQGSKGGTDLTDADSGGDFTTDAALTIPNTPGWHCDLEIGADTHDITHNSITLDISAEGFAAGEIYSVRVRASNAIRVFGPAGQFDESDFS